MPTNRRYEKRSKRSRGRRRAALLALILAAIVAVVLLHHSRGRVRLTPAVAASLAPVPVARETRPPALPWGDATREELARTLQAALAPGVSGAAAYSIAVIAQNGQTLYADEPDRAVAGASTQKLIVADASLTRLGPEFRFDTLLASGGAAAGGTLDTLWLEGSGDPSLTDGDLARGIRALSGLGVRSVAHFAVDPHAIGGEEINPLWNPADANEDFMSATSGVSLDEDNVEFDVTGAAPGEPAHIRVVPQSRDVTYFGSVTSGGGNDVIVAATNVPNEFRLAGNIPPGVEERYWVPVHDIPVYVGAVAAALMHEDDVALEGTPAIGRVPLSAEILWEHRSAPLDTLLHHMLVVSDNHYAEQIMRTLGGVESADPTDSGGIAAERRILAEEGIPTPGLHLVDGSGLSHDDRVAAITLARILAYEDARPGGNVLYPLLPRGGVDGTLKYYRFGAAAGRVRAKTGHIDNASALAGYVETRHHGRVVFAFLVDGSPGDPDLAFIRAVDRISEY